LATPNDLLEIDGENARQLFGNMHGESQAMNAVRTDGGVCAGARERILDI
jgi:hypothetical protein